MILYVPVKLPGMSADDAATAIWQQHKQAADLAFKHGNYPEAASNYTKVIIALNEDRSSKPAVSDKVKVYANRSLACLKMADFKEALKDAQIAGAALSGCSEVAWGLLPPHKVAK